MAKDPAVLWYWGDWNSGTSTLTRHLKGCYIDLLHAQFNSGPLSLEEIRTVLGADFAAWGTLQKKFKKTETGLFFNERMELEKTRRKKFSESRRQNVNSRYKSTSVDTSVEHMNLHMENENDSKDSLDSHEGFLGENLPPVPFTFDFQTPIPAKILELAEMNQHARTGNSNTEFLRCQWKVFLNERSNDPPVKKSRYQRMSDLTDYFLNWIRTKHPNNESFKRNSTRGSKSDGANILLEDVKTNPYARRTTSH